MTTVTRDMGMTHRDFFRTFPKVACGRPWRHDAEAVTLDTEDGEVKIRLGPEREHRLGLLTLPMTRVEFDFNGHDEAQVAAFMARFDLSFRRGGG